MVNGFRCAWWLRSPHLQSLWGRLVAGGRRRLPLCREVLATPDGDELILDRLEAQPHCASRNAGPAPRLLLLHGLEGSSNSGYIHEFLAYALARGWNATVLNFRSCARQPDNASRMIPNRGRRLYHSGETTDLDLVLHVLAGREPSAPLMAAGVSLGGNVLLKWLGENPGQRLLAAAATVSVPYDLAAGARHLERPLGRLYVRFFLETLKPKALGVLARFPELGGVVNAGAVHASRTFWEFDDAATAPLHGFRGAADYYTRSSSIGFAGRIATPVLCLSAEDDPFLPREALARFRATASPSVELFTTRRGGHVGFVSGSSPWDYRFWAEGFVLDWLEARLDCWNPASIDTRPGSPPVACGET